MTIQRLTRGEAIRKFCLQCMGGSAYEVRMCTAPACPLFRYRLGNENKAIKIENASKTEVEN
jgi:hypothetical protein